MLAGDVPYVDVVDTNWPGGFWLHALSAWYISDYVYPWRIVDFVLMLAAVAFAGDVLRRTHGSVAAWLLAWLYPLLYVTGSGMWFPGQRDIIAGHALMVAAWFHLRAWERGSARWQIGTGVMIAVAMLLKPTAGVAGLAFVLHGVLTRDRGQGWRCCLAQVITPGIIAATGVLFGFGVSWLQGAPLRAIWDCAFVYNAIVQFWETRTLLELLAGWWYWISTSWHWFTALALLGVLVRPDGSNAWRCWSLFPSLWLAGAASYFIQQRGFGYHLGVFYAMNLVLAAIGTASLWRHATTSGTNRRCWFARLALLIVGLGVVAKLENLEPGARFIVGDLDHREYLEEFTAGCLTMADAMTIVEFVRAETSTGEYVLVRGRESVINHLARRPQPTRFYYGPTIINAQPPLPMADEWNAQFADDLRQRPPALCIVDRNFQVGARDRGIAAASVIDSLLAGYALVEQLGGADVYVRVRR